MVISAVPEDAVAMIVVEVSHEPVSIARNLREIRERNLKRGDAVSMTFDDMEIPKGLILRRCPSTSSRSNSGSAENFAGYHLPPHLARLGVTERIHALSMVSEARPRSHDNSD